MTAKQTSASGGRLRQISLELTNICNLRCSYCVRDDESLYRTPAHYFSPDLLRRILSEAAEAHPLELVSFTGGEATLHPRFGEVLEAVAAAGMRFTIVTNGWHFERVRPHLLAHRDAIGQVSFSLDGVTAAEHDRWRGEGSFARVMMAAERCRDERIPMGFQVTIRRDTAGQLGRITQMVSKLGARSLRFSHYLPTSAAGIDASALSFAEQRVAEREITALSLIFRMEVGINTGYYNTDSAPPCIPLRGESCNIDFQGRLTLCCNLSDYRGAGGATDVVADLTREPFAPAFERLSCLAAEQLERRRVALSDFAARGEQPDLETGSPCLFCIKSFSKTPWRAPVESQRASLPVLGSQNGTSLPVSNNKTISGLS
jgi:MoaA/NifB/PqqE/SkfB family radical SAM enzyme